MKKLAVHEGTVLVPEPMFNAMVAVVEAAQEALELWPPMFHTPSNLVEALEKFVDEVRTK